jgi:hypothetical protein
MRLTQEETMEQDINWDRVSLITWLSEQIDNEATVMEDAESAENEYEHVYALGARGAFIAVLKHIMEEN